MNTPSNVMDGFPSESEAVTPAAEPATRPLYWSVRRELWENRSIGIAPLSVATVALLGFLVHEMMPPHHIPSAPVVGMGEQGPTAEMTYGMVVLVLILTGFLVGVFYSLDALHGERRDRSILFWKSLPVSDRTTVLSKACIPLLVVPLLTFAIIVATQTVMLMVAGAFHLARGGTVAAAWGRFPLLEGSAGLLYALAATALWHAPVYAWLLLVSGWARRVPFLWAVLPLPAIAAFEWLAFRTSHFASLVQYRVVGWFTLAFQPLVGGRAPKGPLLDPGMFLTDPGLWIGLALAAVFLVAAVRVRRERDPI